MNHFPTLFLIWGCQPKPLEPKLVESLQPTTALNKIQVFGTHNSYHVAPETDAVAEWNYTHASLTEQLDMGIRQFEIDVVRDPDSGELLVQHVPILDAGSTCYLLIDCLNEFESWLGAHPNTVPLQILIEPKTELHLVDDQSYGCLRRGFARGHRSLGVECR